MLTTMKSSTITKNPMRVMMAVRFPFHPMANL
jgi:hypothetical protein